MTDQRNRKPRYECPVCDRKYVTRYNLNRHMATKHDKLDEGEDPTTDEHEEEEEEEEKEEKNHKPSQRRNKDIFGYDSADDSDTRDTWYPERVYSKLQDPTFIWKWPIGTVMEEMGLKDFSAVKANSAEFVSRLNTEIMIITFTARYLKLSLLYQRIKKTQQKLNCRGASFEKARQKAWLLEKSQILDMAQDILEGQSGDEDNTDEDNSDVEMQ